MKNNHKLLLVTSLSLCALITAVFAFSNFDGNNVKSAKAYTAQNKNLPTTIYLNDLSDNDVRSYYSSLNSLDANERKGTNLLKNLKPILKNGQKYYRYDGSDYNLWPMYEIIDRDWKKSPASDLNKVGSSTYGEGTYDPDANVITNYKYGESMSKHDFDPYIHALYVNRNVENQTTAWSDHEQSQWGINQEHIWPKAQGFNASGAGGVRGDPMHLWAGNGRVNGTEHSDNPYGFVDTNKTYTDPVTKVGYTNLAGNYSGTSLTLGSGKVFEPQDSDKGDIARAVFYLVARYNYYSGSDPDGIDQNNPNLELVQAAPNKSSYTSSTTVKGQMGVLSDLLAWNRLDPPDEFEIHRNNLLYRNYTNNRNPFIDFPEWAEYIWGSTTLDDDNRSVLDFSTTPTGYAKPTNDSVNAFYSSIKVTSVTLNKSSISLTVDDTETLTATVLPDNATDKTVAWTSDNIDVATVSSTGVVTAISAGTCIISATAGNITANCSVTVSNKVTPSDSGATLYSGVLTEGDYVIYYNGKAMKNSVESSRLTYESVTPSDGVISNPSSDILWHIAPSGNYWTIYNSAVSKYAASTGAKNVAALTTTEDDKILWSVTGTSTYEFVNKYNSDAGVNCNLRNNGTYGFATYSTSTGEALSLYKYTSEEPVTLSSIEVSNPKTTYTVGDEFEKPKVTANYSDSTTADVTSTAVFSGYNLNETGEQTVNVSYTESAVTKETSYQITVEDRSIVSVDSPYLNGVPYKFYIERSGTKYYFTGTTADKNYYGATSTSYSDACDVYFEQNGDGQNLYIKDGDDIIYIQIIISGSYKNFALSADEPTYIWKYSTDYNCIYTVINDVNYTIGNRSDQSFTTIGAFYFGNNVNYPGLLHTATSFSSLLLEDINCDNSGNSEPTYDNYDWSDLHSIFNTIDSSEQKILKNADALENETIIERAMKKYDYIVSKYGEEYYENFIERNLSLANTFNILNTKVSDSSYIIVIISALSLFSVGFIVLNKKRKEVNR